jgi:hypothetical protein
MGNYVTGKYKSYLVFLYIVRRYTETEEYSFARGLWQAENLAQQMVMTGWTLRIFSDSVCVVVNCFTETGGINQSRKKKNKILFLFLPNIPHLQRIYTCFIVLYNVTYNSINYFYFPH